MTEEEKREFEEFLQWKAERAKEKESVDNLASGDMETELDNMQKNQYLSAEATDSDSVSQDGNKNALAIIIIVAIITLAIIAIVLNNKKSNENFRAANDSVAVAVDDDISFNPVNALQDSIELAEKLRQDSIERAERIMQVKKTIKITSAYLGRPNSASGVDAYFYYKNLSDKTIKYLVWVGYPMNAVGDRVSCDIRGYRDYRGQDTGPVKPGKSSGGCWGCAWYNSTAKKLVLTGIEIEYMDGSTFIIKENEIDYVR